MCVGSAEHPAWAQRHERIGEAQYGGRQDDLSERGTDFALEALAKAVAEGSLQPLGRALIFTSLMTNEFKTYDL